MSKKRIASWAGFNQTHLTLSPLLPPDAGGGNYTVYALNCSPDEVGRLVTWGEEYRGITPYDNNIQFRAYSPFKFDSVAGATLSYNIFSALFLPSMACMELPVHAIRGDSGKFATETQILGVGCPFGSVFPFRFNDETSKYVPMSYIPFSRPVARDGWIFTGLPTWSSRIKNGKFYVNWLQHRMSRSGTFYLGNVGYVLPGQYEAVYRTNPLLAKDLGGTYNPELYAQSDIEGRGGAFTIVTKISELPGQTRVYFQNIRPFILIRWFGSGTWKIQYSVVNKAGVVTADGTSFFPGGTIPSGFPLSEAVNSRMFWYLHIVEDDIWVAFYGRLRYEAGTPNAWRLILPDDKDNYDGILNAGYGNSVSAIVDPGGTYTKTIDMIAMGDSVLSGCGCRHKGRMVFHKSESAITFVITCVKVAASSTSEGTFIGARVIGEVPPASVPFRKRYKVELDGQLDPSQVEAFRKAATTGKVFFAMCAAFRHDPASGQIRRSPNGFNLGSLPFAPRTYQVLPPTDQVFSALCITFPDGGDLANTLYYAPIEGIVTYYASDPVTGKDYFYIETDSVIQPHAEGFPDPYYYGWYCYTIIKGKENEVAISGYPGDASRGIAPLPNFEFGFDALNVFSVGDDAEKIMAMASLNDILYIFTDKAGYAVTGDLPVDAGNLGFPANFQVRKIANFGAFPNGLGTDEGYLYVCSPKGIYIFSGFSYELLSRDLVNDPAFAKIHEAEGSNYEILCNIQFTQRYVLFQYMIMTSDAIISGFNYPKFFSLCWVYDKFLKCFFLLRRFLSICKDQSTQAIFFRAHPAFLESTLRPMSASGSGGGDDNGEVRSLFIHSDGTNFYSFSSYAAAYQFDGMAKVQIRPLRRDDMQPNSNMMPYLAGCILPAVQAEDPATLKKPIRGWLNFQLPFDAYNQYLALFYSTTPGDSNFWRSQLGIHVVVSDGSRLFLAPGNLAKEMKAVFPYSSSIPSGVRSPYNVRLNFNVQPGGQVGMNSVGLQIGAIPNMDREDPFSFAWIDPWFFGLDQVQVEYVETARRK